MYNFEEYEDLKLTHDGDLDIEEQRSVTGIGYLKQQVKNRIKTINPDWFFDEIGADLEEIVGEPNTKDTAEIGVRNIRKTLLRDSLFQDKDISIKPTPVNEDSIVYFIFLQVDGIEPIIFRADVSLSAGINIMEVE